MQNIRPSVDNFPKELLPLLESCWEEDQKLRPEFVEIIQTLTKLLHSSHTTKDVDHHEALRDSYWSISATLPGRDEGESLNNHPGPKVKETICYRDKKTEII